VKGFSKTDRLRNVCARRELGNISFNGKIEEITKKWKEHLQRMDGARIPTQAMICKLYGKRDMGRYKERWTHKCCRCKIMYNPRSDEEEYFKFQVLL
jgi:hypothetical protein